MGFFAVMQAWLNLLDMGLSPTLARQVAHTRGQDSNFTELKRLLRSLEIIFFSLSVCIGLSVVLSSRWIAENWLQVETLRHSEVAYCIALMGIMVGMRWFASLYRSGINGMEHQVWLNGANMLLTTLRFVGALALLRWISQEPRHFFTYQLVISIIELGIIGAKFYTITPTSQGVGLRFDWPSVKAVLPFAGGIAYTAVIWILLTQLDKLLLSKILPLKEYGYFALVAVVANGVLQLAAPISQALLPRLTYLLSQGKEQEMLASYRKATQIMAVIMLPLTGMVALFSTELLFAWTGNKTASEWAGPILFWYVLGNGILAVGAFQYYLQFAHGKLRMHVIYNTISASVQVPIVIFAVFNYGAMGVAVAWFSFRVITFFIWPPIVHHKFAPGIHRKWLFNDIGPIFVATAVMLLLANAISLDFVHIGRLETFAALIGMGTFVLLINVFVSTACRKLLIATFRKVRSC